MRVSGYYPISSVYSPPAKHSYRSKIPAPLTRLPLTHEQAPGEIFKRIVIIKISRFAPPAGRRAGRNLRFLSREDSFEMTEYRLYDTSNWHTTSVLDLRSPGSTGHLFLFFFFQFSFFLWIKLGLFLLFPFAFIFFSFITHISFSLLENDLRRTVAAET